MYRTLEWNTETKFIVVEFYRKRTRIDLIGMIEGLWDRGMRWIERSVVYTFELIIDKCITVVQREWYYSCRDTVLTDSHHGFEIVSRTESNPFTLYKLLILNLLPLYLYLVLQFPPDLCVHFTSSYPFFLSSGWNFLLSLCSLLFVPHTV